MNQIHLIQTPFNCKCQNPINLSANQNRTVLDVLCVDQSEIRNSGFWPFYMCSGNGGCTNSYFAGTDQGNGLARRNCELSFLRHV